MLQAPPVAIVSIDEIGDSSASSLAWDALAEPHGGMLVELRSRVAPQTAPADYPTDWAGLALSPAPLVSREPVASVSVASLAGQGGATPLPPPRPAEYMSRAAAAQASARQLAERQPEPADGQNFFDQFFGVTQVRVPQKSSSSALAYAATPESGLLDSARKMLSGPPSRFDQYTAVYEIATHTVHLPNGTKLEAHSGLGSRLDDPRYVHEKMRGATPPNVYELKLRERLFHGVQALRLSPVGEGTVFGRAGLLAHTYMLGPRGDSNGCVVFKNYPAFLQAFQSGEVKRLAVVARLD